MTRGTSRRAFVRGAASMAAAGVLAPGLRLARAHDAASTAAPAHSAGHRLRDFDYGSVELTGGPLKSQYDFIHAHYLGLDNDRLLRVYRQHAGLAAPGLDMGGWYGESGFIPGHSFGQYVSGLARLGRSTGDADCHRKVAQLIDGFAATLAANSNPYAGPGAQQLWPAYVLDKHVIGLIDAYTLSGVERARSLIPDVVRGALPFISPVSRDRVGVKTPPYDETYILPENLFAAARLTGDSRLRQLAVKYLLDAPYFDPLARGEDVLAGRHAYSHVMALSSAARAYVELGDPRYHAAAANGWKFLERQSYASGGWGPNETLVRSGTNDLAASLTTTDNHFETPCGCYATMKLARYLMRFSADARYGDGLERVMYNGVLAVKAPDSEGNSPYYSSYNPGATKVFYPAKWPCCSGTLVQGVADYVRNIYFQATGAIYVNLFTPSRVRWRIGGRRVNLTQETDYPAGEQITLAVDTDAPAAFAVMIRIPGWLQQNPEIRVNGRRVTSSAAPGTFAALRRTWKRGDRIELQLPQAFRQEPIDASHPGTVALMRGPLMYCALDFGGSGAPASPGRPLAQLTSAPLTPVAGTRQSYVQASGAQQTIFVPFYTVENESYDVYFQRT
ncbi:MAG TPA: beta-L-arabinofuranosidase domain-containing protein [Steroidobacteraceae bacterium]|nr:beta-L-arabinofuranosidase domain-containing protein [Steroidobacteraceae bacterium]